jgi:hypothetical protein
MNRFSPWILAGLVAAAPAFAQQEKSVNGLTVNLGLMTAEKAVHAEGHRDAHPATFPHGSQHVLITIMEGKTHNRIGDATVVVVVRGPNVTVRRSLSCTRRPRALPTTASSSCSARRASTRLA